MSAHTPGPWTQHGIDVFGNDEYGAVFVCSMREGQVASPLEANARLIAAAPELLEALRVFVALDGDSPSDDFMEAARAAIAKAEGQPSHA